ncbi:zinc ABC transporter substrate-binding protein [Roseovarius dicentrarchi]|uniref:zinc ABC transporter substrate-binding protein n=1 Tax=Roseovarius dicentrarchi TaxID=2250573 RepID=UPI000DEAE31F|nr:zinc ABC transporter substrate-binding protein [Roseovarius dicentrarchi]
MFNQMKQITLAAGLTLAVAAGPAGADVPNVATDVAPVQSLVARVMGDLGAASVIVRPGASPHGYALRPSEAGSLQAADAVFWIGPSLTPWLEGAITALAPDATVVPLLEAGGTHLLDFRTEAAFGAAAHGSHDHGDHSDHDDHGDHHHQGTDPHAWLDPQNAQVWLDVIAQKLSDLDPENAQTYAANAQAGRAEFAALEAQIAHALAPVQDTPFVVFHDAFQYFEHRFQLAAAGAIAHSDASDPGPARVAEVRRIVQDSGARCVLSEPAFNPALVQTVIDGTSVRTASVDPMGSDIAPGAAFYPALLRSISAALTDCLK